MAFGLRSNALVRPVVQGQCCVNYFGCGDDGNLNYLAPRRNGPDDREYEDEEA